MPSRPDLTALKGVAWLVHARNEIQLLMWRLHLRWRHFDRERREYAAGVAFSLWRATFLLAEKEIERPFRTADGKSVGVARVAAAAEDFLLQVVRTNAITFTDEMKRSPFTAGYYINNAIYRVTDMRGQARSHRGSSVKTLRAGWNEAFRYLDEFVGTIPGTAKVSQHRQFKRGQSKRSKY